MKKLITTEKERGPHPEKGKENPRLHRQTIDPKCLKHQQKDVSRPEANTRAMFKNWEEK